MWTILLAACSPDPSVDADPTVPWTHQLPEAGSIEIGRELTWHRSIIHLHSPFSHDACDGEGLVNGAPDAACLQSLRDGLCDTRIDVAYLTDHPDNASWQDWPDLFLATEADDALLSDGAQPIGAELACADRGPVLIRTGIEDDLMPIGLRRTPSDDPDVNHELYNSSDPETVRALVESGANVLVAHTESRDVDQLSEQLQAGLTGFEIFNVHAMFAPDIRSEFLDLDPTGWASDIGRFLQHEPNLQPDLLFLNVLERQIPTLEKFDALLQDGPVVGIGGSDAHQNVLDAELLDGERVDSYRRSLRWMTNLVLTDDPSLDGLDRAIAKGRVVVVFEVLGTPNGFDFALVEDDGDRVEMGSNGSSGTLEVACPTLHESSPRGALAPEITVSILKDGQPWQQGCGSFEAEPGVYRVEVDLIPWHLQEHLGESPDSWMRAYPWILSNAIRVTGA